MSVKTAILLAASDVEIDGTPVPLLPWRDGETLIEFEIEQLQAAGVDVIEVVLGAQADAIIPLIARNDVEPIIDTRWQDGDESWLRVGSAAVPRDTTTAAITYVEQPRPAPLYRSLFDALAATGAPLVRAAYGGVPGFPIVVSPQVLAEVRNLSHGALTTLLERHRDVTVRVESDLALMEIAKLADLHILARRWAAD